MISFKRSRLFLVSLASFLLLTVTTASADDVTTTIQEALTDYENGEYTDAIDSLTYASQLIQQKKGQGLEAFLPAPLTGWVAEPSGSASAGAAMFGGGIAAEGHYTKKPQGSVMVQIVTDSPLIQGVMMMLSNPMFATANGGKLERIKRQKAIVAYDPGSQSGQIKIVVAGRLFVGVEGEGITLDELRGYAKGINYKKLAAMQ